MTITERLAALPELSQAGVHWDGDYEGQALAYSARLALAVELLREVPSVSYCECRNCDNARAFLEHIDKERA